jgi:hypothetical protein
MKGDECQFSNCNNEPSMCLTDFGTSFCQDAKICNYLFRLLTNYYYYYWLLANYCPKMCNQPICKCGFDSCLNGGFFMASSCSCICSSQYSGVRCENLILTTTVATTKAACTILPCLNNAKQNQATCKCECYPAYTGTFCETLICANEPIECKNPNIFTVAECTKDLVLSYCPLLCGKCQITTTTLTTQIKACVPINCVNGKISVISLFTLN